MAAVCDAGTSTGIVCSSDPYTVYAIVDANAVWPTLSTRQWGMHVVPFFLEEIRRCHLSSLPLQLGDSAEMEISADGSLVDIPLSPSMAEVMAIFMALALAEVGPQKVLEIKTDS
ncbi:hypothetical protein EV179_005177 [Coemansia sp. RSA 487]|nr:hypothetical protein LPJ74_006298 [Coemansia sp. RSA 1843]KAJ2086593.1 hypothetical protein IW138_005586 [Coemansia sp. RSA 986]KAJ2211806.1 hypothetical protein EV179_005177 [Coemansia sp. RSA 487]